MVYAKTLPELIHMIEMLFEELQKVGLAPNQSKTKILSTNIDDEQLPRAVQIHNYSIEILGKHDTHKYLGRKINVHLHPHSQIEVNHPKHQYWAIFHKHKHILTDQNISIKLRLKLFASYITPVAIFTMGAMPLTKSQREEMRVCQFKMLRQILGWRRKVYETWEMTMHDMNTRIDRAMILYFCAPWDMEICRRQ